MAQGTRICKVCGKEYPYCKTERRVDLFRYQDVACCKEHAAIYFRDIAISRGEQPREEDAKLVAEMAPVADAKQEREPKRQAKSTKKE